MLAQAVRRLENAVQRGRVSGSDYARYQAIALLAREERGRVRSDSELNQVRRDSELKRLDGIATILAQIAASEPSFFHLLDEKADVSEGTRILMREMQVAAGREPAPEPEPQAKVETEDGRVERRVIPDAVRARQLAIPFQVPDYTAVPQMPARRRLVGLELIEPC